MRSTDDDADGVATKLTFDEDDHTTHDGAGSSGLLAARALAATLSTAHSEVAWLPMENQLVAHRAIDQALCIASMPLDENACKACEVVVGDMIDPKTYKVKSINVHGFGPGNKWRKSLRQSLSGSKPMH